MRAYCIGLPRSGTHSIASMLAGAAISKHEPRSHDSVVHALRYLQGSYSDRTLRAILQSRDAAIGAEVEAAHYLHTFAAMLVDLFPDARFILTIREPSAWLASEVNQNAHARAYPVWRALERSRYDRFGSTYAKAEHPLERLNRCYPLRNYLLYWREHIQRVIDAVPSDRLLILKTTDIARAASRLSQFLLVPEQALDLSRSHEAKSMVDGFNLSTHICSEFILDQVEKYCGNLFAQLFPDLKRNQNGRRSTWDVGPVRHDAATVSEFAK